MMAYGRAFEREGARSGLRRVWQRCLRIYVVQVGLLLTTLVLVHLCRQQFGQEAADLAPFFTQPWRALSHALALHALPPSLNILPLYIVLLGAFPLIYAGVRYAPWVAVPLSGILWLAANFDHALNLTNWLDGQGWFFNPFAWQFLFVIGVLGAATLRTHDGELPHWRPLTVASWLYLGISLLLAAPWTAWGLPDLRLASFDPPDKTALAPVRLLDILAIMYLALGSPRLRRFAQHAWAMPLVACGKHSLEVFALGTLAALVFRLLFHDFGPVWPLQVLVNVVGVGVMVALALWLEHNRDASGHRLGKPVESGGVT